MYCVCKLSVENTLMNHNIVCTGRLKLQYKSRISCTQRGNLVMDDMPPGWYSAGGGKGAPYKIIWNDDICAIFCPTSLHNTGYNCTQFHHDNVCSLQQNNFNLTSAILMWYHQVSLRRHYKSFLWLYGLGHDLSKGNFKCCKLIQKTSILCWYVCYIFWFLGAEGGVCSGCHTS